MGNSAPSGPLPAESGGPDDHSSTLTAKVTWVAAPLPEGVETLRRLGCSAHQAALLARRGVDRAEALKAFLEPSLDDLHSPSLLHGMEAAVDRLVLARDAAQRVALVGDYDVDGVSGTALLSAVLKACGFEVRMILPHRMRDGYGFQPVHVERAQQEGCDLIITIDCGTTSHAAVAAAGQAGLDVVITDHHLPDGEMPAGVIQINPQQEVCEYPFTHLSGAGLAFKLALAVAEACDKPIDVHALLRIACLGTIADLVPLKGENRVIAKLGLEALATTRSPGLKALMQVARVRPPLGADDIGFRLGPRLNAPGRLASAEKSLELLLCRHPGRALRLATDLDQTNRQRQDEERRVAKEAEALFLERQPMPAILVGWSDSWHRGVVGIAAGRLARRFHRPTVLLAVDGESATGSGRSISAIHLHQFLQDFASRFERFGGHAQAIGLTVASAALEELRRDMEEAAEPWRSIVEARSYKYEIDLAVEELDETLISQLWCLAPHGQGNAQPLLKIRGPLRLAAPARRFGNDHLSGQAVGPDGGKIRFVAWGFAPRLTEFEGEFELLGFVERDRYLGGSVLRLLDCRAYEGLPEATAGKA